MATEATKLRDLARFLRDDVCRWLEPVPDETGRREVRRSRSGTRLSRSPVWRRPVRLLL